mgnify:CR=1 FL=1|jgi:hypothetical protein
MEPISEVLRLLRRQAEIQNGLRRSNASCVTDERELLLIRRKLSRYPAAVQAIGIASTELQRPADALSVDDIGKRF